MARTQPPHRAKASLQVSIAWSHRKSVLDLLANDLDQVKDPRPASFGVLHRLWNPCSKLPTQHHSFRQHSTYRCWSCTAWKVPFPNWSLQRLCKKGVVCLVLICHCIVNVDDLCRTWGHTHANALFGPFLSSP